MQEKVKTLGIIPAKGNSVGIPRKNMVTLYNKPLIGWTLAAAGDSKLEYIVVATDDEEIAAYSKQYIGDYQRLAAYMRPPEYSHGFVQTEMVVWWTLAHFFEVNEYLPETVVVLQPTSPFRTAKNIDDVLELFPVFRPSIHNLNPAPHSIISVSSSRNFAYDAEGIHLNPIKHNPTERFGRELYDTDDMLFNENGAIYAAHSEHILLNKTFRLGKLVGYIMNDIESVEIDSELDLFLANAIAKEGSLWL